MKQLALKQEPEGWVVQIGEFVADHLTPGEALEVVAYFLLTNKFPPYMQDPIRMAIWDLRMGRHEHRLLPAPKPDSEDWKVTGHVFVLRGQIRGIQ